VRPTAAGALPRRYGLIVALAVVVTVAGVAVTLLPAFHLASAREASWSTSRLAITGSVGAASAAEPAIAALLARRGTAVVRHDRAAFAGTQTASAHGPAYTRLAALPWSRWAYTVTAVHPPTAGGDVVAEVSLRTRLRGETADSVTPERISLRSAGPGWAVTAERAVSGTPLWDLGRLTAWTGQRVLVIGVDVDAATVRGYGAIADRVVPDVVAVWGRGWGRRAVVVVPRTQAMLATALGQRPADLDGFAAVTTSGDGTGGPVRVWTNTPAFAGLSDLGREVVLRHEITHVATAAPASTTTPVWLEEGFAEYVGYRGSGIPQPVALADLVRAARAGRVLHATPAYSDFHGSQVAVSYEAAELACALVAEHAGTAGLVRLYRLTEAGTGSPDANAWAALHAVTGWRAADFERVWRARLARLAG
jgi:hypothetical protein